MDNNAIRFDLLKELNNIGGGSALTSLSKLVNEKMSFHVPKIKVYDLNKVTDIVNNSDQNVIGVLAQLEEDIKGTLMFIVDIEGANALIGTLLEKDIKTGANFDDMELSVLKEISNIMFSAYVTTLSTMGNVNVKMSTTCVAIDMAAAILSVPATEFGKISDKAVFVESEFNISGEIVVGYLLMIPEADSYNALANAMGVGV